VAIGRPSHDSNMGVGRLFEAGACSSLAAMLVRQRTVGARTLAWLVAAAVERASGEIEEQEGHEQGRGHDLSGQRGNKKNDRRADGGKEKTYFWWTESVLTSYGPYL
jgi:hypothetical protein